MIIKGLQIQYDTQKEFATNLQKLVNENFQLINVCIDDKDRNKVKARFTQEVQVCQTEIK